jgi:hypothetical protein
MSFYWLMLGMLGVMLAMILHSSSSFWGICLMIPSSTILVVVLSTLVLITFGKERVTHSRWFLAVERWLAIALRGIFSLLGLGLMFGGLPLAIATDPTVRQLVCHKIPGQSQLANCYVEMTTRAGWGNYRQDYAEIKQAKVMVVNAKSSSVPGQARQRRNAVVQLHPAFLTDRRGRSQKIEPVIPREEITTNVVTQVNRFLQSPEPSLSVDFMEIGWVQDSDGFGGGSTMPSQSGHRITSLFAVPITFLVGGLFALHHLFRLIGNPKFGDGE